MSSLEKQSAKADRLYNKIRKVIRDEGINSDVDETLHYFVEALVDGDESSEEDTSKSED